MSETITVWQVLVVLLFPLLGGGFVMLWTRGSEQWSAIDGLRREVSELKVEIERNFVRTDVLRMLEARLDDRFDRIDLKLDRLLPAKS
ncbi:hypothetical protein [Magnetospirillum sulfuroxidans]|uniref:Uncharacterized protein n=1 Tax=Magnetospirillum sulfuroxidans TaxID=611300 RepID=A0ABS5I909_9PROT|nr:hypothetical protein [Magnetospirillum sulfuroxidans]MBR9970804.1 hypothetical protein [Magnetospirillum sulfuroxidans]